MFLLQILSVYSIPLFIMNAALWDPTTSNSTDTTTSLHNILTKVISELHLPLNLRFIVTSCFHPYALLYHYQGVQYVHAVLAFTTIKLTRCHRFVSCQIWKLLALLKVGLFKVKKCRLQFKQDFCRGWERQWALETQTAVRLLFVRFFHVLSTV